MLYVFSTRFALDDPAFFSPGPAHLRGRADQPQQQPGVPDPSLAGGRIQGIEHPDVTDSAADAARPFPSEASTPSISVMAPPNAVPTMMK